MHVPFPLVIFAAKSKPKIMEKKNLPITALLTLLLFLTALMPTSCGSDEPEMLVGYYLTIDSQVRLSLLENDEEQGTSANPDEDVLSNTIVKMKKALQDSYPEATYNGNDAAVIAALDDIYKQYKSMYSHLERGTVCTVKLYRAKLDNGIVVNSKSIKVFLFGALPQSTEQPTL